MAKLKTSSHNLLPLTDVLLISGKTIQQEYVIFAIIVQFLFRQIHYDFAGDQFPLFHVLFDCLGMQPIVFLLLT